MANYEHVKIKCSNEKVMDELKRIYGNGNDDYYDYEMVKQEDGSISFYNREWNTHEELLELTKKEEFKDVVVTAICHPEYYQYTREYHMCYFNGYFKQIGMDISYTYGWDIQEEEQPEILSEISEELEEEIFNKAKDFFREKVDTVTQDENEEFIIDDNPDMEITLRFKIDGYITTVCKTGSFICIKDMEKINEIEEVEEVEKVKELPWLEDLAEDLECD